MGGGGRKGASAGRGRPSRSFLETQMGYDAAPVSLDLAILYAQEGQAAELQRLAAFLKREGVGRGPETPGEDLPEIGEAFPQIGEAFPQIGEPFPEIGQRLPDFGEPPPQIGEDLPK